MTHRLDSITIIQALHTGSFVSLSALRELHIEENRLKDLSHLTPLVNLQRLYLGMNKIQVSHCNNSCIFESL